MVIVTIVMSSQTNKTHCTLIRICDGNSQQMQDIGEGEWNKAKSRIHCTEHIFKKTFFLYAVIIILAKLMNRNVYTLNSTYTITH